MIEPKLPNLPRLAKCGTSKLMWSFRSSSDILGHDIIPITKRFRVDKPTFPSPRAFPERYWLGWFVGWNHGRRKRTNHYTIIFIKCCLLRKIPYKRRWYLRCPLEYSLQFDDTSLAVLFRLRPDDEIDPPGDSGGVRPTTLMVRGNLMHTNPLPIHSLTWANLAKLDSARFCCVSGTANAILAVAVVSSSELARIEDRDDAEDMDMMSSASSRPTLSPSSFWQKSPSSSSE